jgi:hypothetical protein
VDVNPDFYTYRQRASDEIFPLDFIDHGVSKQYLASKYNKPSPKDKNNITKSKRKVFLSSIKKMPILYSRQVKNRQNI